ncbi:hypothetical protein ACHAWF_011552 [Thalassiosira exigua]
MAIKKADRKVVLRDVCAALFDMAGDWTYLVVTHLNAGSYRGVRGMEVQDLMVVILAFSIIGSLLSIWSIATSVGRLNQYKSLCCRCTMPRLAITLILLHHLPIFMLTSLIDLGYKKDVSLEGWFNILSSMVALANGLGATKCGEGPLACEPGLNCSNLTDAELEDDVEMDTIEEKADYKQMSPGNEPTKEEGSGYKPMSPGGTLA